MSWAKVQGHAANVQGFQTAWTKGRLGHAYLFVGPTGVGRYTFALELAKALLCEGKSTTLEACDRCANCLLVAAGTHPDLFFAARPDDKAEFPIKVIQDLLEQLSLKPARGHGKIAILSNVDDFNDESANCFLKYLEEPPAGSTLLLIGRDSTDGMLPTILSRCQVVRFAPLSPAILTELLQRHAVTDPATVARLLRMSNGSIGQALALSDDSLWPFRRTLLETLLAPKLDLFATHEAWMTFVDQAGKEMGIRRRRVGQVLQLFIALLQDAQRVSHGVRPAVAEESEETSLRQLALRLGPERLLSWIDRAIEAGVQNERYLQIELVLEAFIDYLARGYSPTK